MQHAFHFYMTLALSKGVLQPTPAMSALMESLGAKAGVQPIAKHFGAKRKESAARKAKS